MKILFVTYGELSINGADPRPAFVLRALADAGHQVHVVAGRVDLAEHPHITILEGNTSSCRSRLKLCVTQARVSGMNRYDAIHAVDDAVLFSARLCRMRRIPLIYDAARCFCGTVGQAPFRHWNWFPRHYLNVEKRVLKQASAIITPCDTLSADIRQLYEGAPIIQIENVPVQALYCCRDVDRAELTNRFGQNASTVVVCSILPGNRKELRKVLMSARKVIDAVPGASFFFKGSLIKEAQALAANLDIQKHCAFLSENEVHTFLSALDVADASLLVPTPGSRYVHPELFTLLNAPAPVVTIQESAYASLLTDRNCVQALPSAESIAEGVLRVLKEPLLSIGLVAEGQHLVASGYTFSSFKHKIRMAYHEVMNKG